MTFSPRDKTLLGAGLVIVIVAVVMQFSGNLVPSPGSTPDDEGDTSNGVKLTLLTNAGVMIEAKGMRIYIDPIDLPQ